MRGEWLICCPYSLSPGLKCLNLWSSGSDNEKWFQIQRRKIRESGICYSVLFIRINRTIDSNKSSCQLTNEHRSLQRSPTSSGCEWIEINSWTKYNWLERTIKVPACSSHHSSIASSCAQEEQKSVNIQKRRWYFKNLYSTYHLIEGADRTRRSLAQGVAERSRERAASLLLC